MVSSGTVRNDMNSLNTSLKGYSNDIGDLASSWRGDSYQNLVNKGEEFSNEYNSVLNSEMTSFASACDEYQEYLRAKANLLSAQAGYNQAAAEGDEAAMSSYSSLIAQYQAEMERLKAMIEASLAAASATRLTASASSQTSSYSFSAGQALGVGAGIYDYSFTDSQGRTMNYHSYIPDNATEGMPLVVYLHGDGSVGRFEHLRTNEMYTAVQKLYGDNPPFIYIQPNTDITSWTEGGRLDTLAELIQDVAAEYKCDPNKIILTGASRGGMGSWKMADQYHDMFSAFIPIAGNGRIDPNNFVNLPTVAVSSTDGSDSWNYSNMSSNVKKINEAGGNATFVSADGYSHSNVIYAGITKEILEWALSQTRHI